MSDAGIRKPPIDYKLNEENAVREDVQGLHIVHKFIKRDSNSSVPVSVNVLIVKVHDAMGEKKLGRHCAVSKVAVLSAR